MVVIQVSLSLIKSIRERSIRKLNSPNYKEDKGIKGKTKYEWKKDGRAYVIKKITATFQLSYNHGCIIYAHTYTLSGEEIIVFTNGGKRNSWNALQNFLKWKSCKRLNLILIILSKTTESLVFNLTKCHYIGQHAM